MATSITVNYTPQTTGNHVICYQQTAPIDDGLNFCCLTDPTVITPALVGVPQVFVIPDIEIACAGVGSASVYVGGEATFNGYVNPACDPSDPAVIKTPWDAPVVLV